MSHRPGFFDGLDKALLLIAAFGGAGAYFAHRAGHENMVGGMIDDVIEVFADATGMNEGLPARSCIWTDDCPVFKRAP